jgi:hypothetical protein
MIYATIAFVSTIGLMTTPVAAAGNRMQKANFIREMEAATANKKIPNTKTILNSPTLRKKVMEKATPLHAGDRKLQDNGNANQAADVNAQSQNDGADDYFMAFGEWNNAFGFDPTQYSLSYHRCAEVRQFDDDLAAQEDSSSVFATKHFAVFRFCPSETCSGIKEEEEELNWGYAKVSYCFVMLILLWRISTIETTLVWLLGKYSGRRNRGKRRKSGSKSMKISRTNTSTKSLLS